MRFGAQGYGIMRFTAKDYGIMKVPKSHAWTLSTPWRGTELRNGGYWFSPCPCDQTQFVTICQPSKCKERDLMHKRC
jgi:hypothetical protein